MILVNAGSGQRPFPPPWVNLDIRTRHSPGLVADMNLMPFRLGSADMIVCHHTFEHIPLEVTGKFVSQVHSTLRTGGSFIVCVPNAKALAQRYSMGMINDYIFAVNMFGAHMGDDADYHRWCYSYSSLKESLDREEWACVKTFDYRNLYGAPVAHDWWILAMEAVK